MAKGEVIKIQTPLGFFEPILKIGNEQHAIYDGANKHNQIVLNVYMRNIPVEKMPHVNETYLFNLSFKWNSLSEDVAVLFDFDAREYKGIGEYDSGEDFDSVCWENEGHIAHLGFRNAIDQGKKKVDDFDGLDWKLPSKENSYLSIFLPRKDTNHNIEFNAAFSWGVKINEDISTYLAADMALPVAEW